VRELQASNKELAAKCQAAAASQGGDAKALQEELNAKQQELEGKIAENAELQKVCNELFSLVEQKEAS